MICNDLLGRTSRTNNFVVFGVPWYTQSGVYFQVHMNKSMITILYTFYKFSILSQRKALQSQLMRAGFYLRLKNVKFNEEITLSNPIRHVGFFLEQGFLKCLYKCRSRNIMHVDSLISYRGGSIHSWVTAVLTGLALGSSFRLVRPHLKFQSQRDILN